MADDRFPYDVASQNPNRNGAGETVVFKRKNLRSLVSSLTMTVLYLVFSLLKTQKSHELSLT